VARCEDLYREEPQEHDGVLRCGPPDAGQSEAESRPLGASTLAQTAMAAPGAARGDAGGKRRP
jgi:hypothetical protein